MVGTDSSKGTACAIVAKYCLDARDFQSATMYATKGFSLGSPEASVTLAFLYILGLPTPGGQDGTTYGMRMLSDLSAAGHGMASFLLGQIYRGFVESVEPDDEKSLELMELAAKQEWPEALCHMARALFTQPAGPDESDEQVTKRVVEAYLLASRAARLGYKVGGDLIIAGLASIPALQPYATPRRITLYRLLATPSYEALTGSAIQYYSQFIHPAIAWDGDYASECKAAIDKARAEFDEAKFRNVLFNTQGVDSLNRSAGDIAPLLYCSKDPNSILAERFGFGRYESIPSPPETDGLNVDVSKLTAASAIRLSDDQKLSALQELLGDTREPSESHDTNSAVVMSLVRSMSPNPRSALDRPAFEWISNYAAYYKKKADGKQPTLEDASPYELVESDHEDDPCFDPTSTPEDGSDGKEEHQGQPPTTSPEEDQKSVLATSKPVTEAVMDVNAPTIPLRELAGNTLSETMSPAEERRSKVIKAKVLIRRKRALIAASLTTKEGDAPSQAEITDALKSSDDESVQAALSIIAAHEKVAPTFLTCSPKHIITRIRALFEMLCQLDPYAAARSFGHHYEVGSPFVRKNPALAASLYSKASLAKGSPFCMYMLARGLMRGLIDRSLTKLPSYYGTDDSNDHLHIDYINPGVPTEPGLKKVVEVMTQGVEAGHPLSGFLLGQLQYSQKRVPDAIDTLTGSAMAGSWESAWLLNEVELEGDFAPSKFEFRGGRYHGTENPLLELPDVNPLLQVVVPEMEPKARDRLARLIKNSHRFSIVDKVFSMNVKTLGDTPETFIGDEHDYDNEEDQDDGATDFPNLPSGQRSRAVEGTRNEGADTSDSDEGGDRDDVDEKVGEDADIGDGGDDNARSKRKAKATKAPFDEYMFLEGRARFLKGNLKACQSPADYNDFFTRALLFTMDSANSDLYEARGWSYDRAIQGPRPVYHVFKHPRIHHPRTKGSKHQHSFLRTGSMGVPSAADIASGHATIDSGVGLANRSELVRTKDAVDALRLVRQQALDAIREESVYIEEMRLRVQHSNTREARSTFRDRRRDVKVATETLRAIEADDNETLMARVRFHLKEHTLAEEEEKYAHGKKLADEDTQWLFDGYNSTDATGPVPYTDEQKERQSIAKYKAWQARKAVTHVLMAQVNRVHPSDVEACIHVLLTANIALERLTAG